MNFIGIDLGGTEIKAGIVCENGNIIDKITRPTPVKDGPQGVVNSINLLIDKLMKKNIKTIKSIDAIGIGVPGVCNNEGLVYFAPNLFWNNVALAKLLKDKIKIPIFIENDATVASIGEATCGSTKNVSNSVLITLGTGIGSGIIINKQIFNGSHGIGSEVGHMIIGENFYNCNCGNNGCLETFASASALIKYTKNLLEGNQDSLILEKIDNNTNLLNAKLIFDCAKKGDFIANEAVDRLVKYLAIGIGNIINLLDPEVIALGGGISKAGHYLINKLEKEVPKNIWLKSMNLTKIVLANLGNDAGIIGSAMYAKSKL